MSLDWNLTAIADRETLCWVKPEGAGPDEAKMSPVTETIIFLTMGVGLNRITADNWRDFYTRVDMLQRTGGPFLYHWPDDGDREPFWLTPEHIRSHTGLRTNASCETLAAFKRRVAANLMRESQRRLDEHDATTTTAKEA